MRTSVLTLCALVLALPAAQAGTGYTSPTQQPGLRIPSGGTSWLLGSLSGLDRLQISHSMSFGYTSGGSFSGPSGSYLIHLAYPFSSNLRLGASVGMDWNPAFAESFGGQPTQFGLREVRLDWRPSSSSHLTFDYISSPVPRFWGWRSAYRAGWPGGGDSWGPTEP